MRAAIVLLFLGLSGQSLPHSKPIPPFSDGLWISSAPSDVYREDDRWRREAIETLWRERSAIPCSPLIHLSVPAFPNLDIIMKDESQNPTGSVSHRTAWLLIFWAVNKGMLKSGSRVVDSSFGNIAVAEARLLNRLGIPFTAIIPKELEENRRRLLIEYGTKIITVNDSSRLVERAQRESILQNAFFLNHNANGYKTFEYSEDVLTAAGGINLFAELITQLRAESRNRRTLPNVFLHSAGSGSTLSLAGWTAKKYGIETEIVLADTEYSAFFDSVLYGKFSNESSESLWRGPGLGGLGSTQRGTLVVGQTMSEVIDRAIKVPDLAAVAAIHFLRSLGINGGPSTGLHYVAALSIAAKLPERNRFRIASVIGDNGIHYEKTYYSPQWIEDNFAPHGGLDTLKCWIIVLQHTYRNGSDPLQIGSLQCPSPIQTLLDSVDTDYNNFNETLS